MYIELNCVIIDADAANRQEMATFLSEHGVTIVALMPSLDALPNLLRRPDPPRLVMVNLDPDGGSPAPEILKAVVRGNQNHAGIYGTVTRVGRLAVGQTIVLHR